MNGGGGIRYQMFFFYIYIFLLVIYLLLLLLLLLLFYFVFPGCYNERVRYDDDGNHVMHVTQGSTDLRTLLRTTSSTMMGLGGCEPPRYSRSHV